MSQAYQDHCNANYGPEDIPRYETCGRCMGAGYSNHPDSGDFCEVCGGSGGIEVKGNNMSQDRVKVAYEAFRGGFRDGGGMPSWEKTSTIIRDLATVCYLQGTLDGPISLLREGSTTMGPNERTQWKKRVLTLLAAIDGPCCKGLAPNAECRCYQEEQKTMPSNNNDLVAARNELRKAFLDGQITEDAFSDRAKKAGMDVCDADAWMKYVKAHSGKPHAVEPRTAAGSLD